MKIIKIISMCLSGLLGLSVVRAAGSMVPDVVPGTEEALSSARITGLDCRGCGVASLELVGCGALRMLHAERNRMSLPSVYALSLQRPDGAAFHLSPQEDDAFSANWQPGEFCDISSRLVDIAGEPTAYTLTNYTGNALPDSLYDVQSGGFRFRKTGLYRLNLTNAAVVDYPEGEAGTPVVVYGFCYVRDTFPVVAGRLRNLDVRGDYSGGSVSDMRLSVATGLDSLRVSDNRLPLSVLAGVSSRRPAGAVFQLNPQSDSITLAVDEVWDLGSEWVIDGQATRRTFYPQASGSDNLYTCSSEGEIRFHEPGDYRLVLRNDSVRDEYGDGTWYPVTFTYYVEVRGTRRPDDTTANEGVLTPVPVVYTRGGTIYLTEDLGEVCVYTQSGQLVYRGRSKAVAVPRAGFYVLRAGARRYKVVVR